MYGKIFESIYDSTLCGDWKAMITFQQLIVLADKDGNVYHSLNGLARKTSIPHEILKSGIESLLQPDSESQSPKENGCRIKRLPIEECGRQPHGWEIVNYAYYRDLGSRYESRENARLRKQRQREREAMSQDVTDCHASSRMSRHTDTDKDKDKEEIYKESFKFKKKVCLPFQFHLTDQMKEYAKKKRYVGNLDTFTEYFISKNKASGSKYKDWYSAWQSWLQKDIEWHPENQEEDLVTL
jgi:hypothetical protein